MTSKTDREVKIRKSLKYGIWSILPKDFIYKVYIKYVYSRYILNFIPNDLKMTSKTDRGQNRK